MRGLAVGAVGLWGLVSLGVATPSVKPAAMGGVIVGALVSIPEATKPTPVGGIAVLLVAAAATYAISKSRGARHSHA